MILFYTNQCKHCNILLDAISKHDKNNIIKTISVETMVNNGYDIDKMIHSVPALAIPKKIKLIMMKYYMGNKYLIIYYYQIEVLYLIKTIIHD